MSEEEGQKRIVQKFPVFLRKTLHAVSRRMSEHAKRN